VIPFSHALKVQKFQLGKLKENRESLSVFFKINTKLALSKFHFEEQMLFNLLFKDKLYVNKKAVKFAVKLRRNVVENFTKSTFLWIKKATIFEKGSVAIHNSVNRFLTRIEKRLISNFFSVIFTCAKRSFTMVLSWSRVSKYILNY
jgi:hypothetical protein